jgi:hypothetical protein
LLISSFSKRTLSSSLKEPELDTRKGQDTSLFIWLGTVPVNTTKVVLQSINTDIEFYFLPLHVSVFMEPPSGSIIIIRLKLFELPNMDMYLVQHIHVINVMPKLNCKNYNNNIIIIILLLFPVASTFWSIGHP